MTSEGQLFSSNASIISSKPSPHVISPHNTSRARVGLKPCSRDLSCFRHGNPFADVRVLVRCWRSPPLFQVTVASATVHAPGSGENYNYKLMPADVSVTSPGNKRRTINSMAVLLGKGTANCLVGSENARVRLLVSDCNHYTGNEGSLSPRSPRAY